MIFRRSKAGRRRFTRIFFATDLHGSTPTFKKFLNGAAIYKADVLVVGGDVSGKVLLPIVDHGDGSYELALHGQATRIAGDERLAEVRAGAATQGYYDALVTPEEYEALHSDEGARDALFLRLVRERLLQWRELAEERLAESGLRCYVTGGNDDDPEALAVLEDRDGALTFSEGRAVMLDDEHLMVSCGWSNPTPWHTPRETTEEELGKRLDEALAGVESFERCIFNFHVPPHDSTLDLCPKLDTSTDPPTPVYEGGQLVEAPAGSTAVREAIERHQPLLGLHGHIHECRGVAKIGRSTCVNPGSEYGEGVLNGCIVNVADDQVLSYQMTSG